MSAFPAAQDRDANRAIVATDEAFRTVKTVTFTGAAGAGAVGTVSLFTVTGDIHCDLFWKCTSDLVSAGGGSLDVGTVNQTSLFDSQAATDYDANMIMSPGNSVASYAAQRDNSRRFWVGFGDDIIATIGTGDITGGVLVFTLFWRPVSDDGLAVAA